MYNHLKIRIMSKENKKQLMFLAGEIAILVGEWLRKWEFPSSTSSNVEGEKWFKDLVLADLRDVQIVFRLKKAQFLKGDKLFV